MLESVKWEGDGFAQFGRSRRHFRTTILIDALLSISLVLGGFGLVNHFTEKSRLDTLLRSGGVELSADELIAHVKHERLSVYWLGPKPGYRYTIICKNRSEIIVTYLPQGVSLNHPDRFNLTVETYSKSLKSEQPALSTLSSDRDDFVESDGTIRAIDALRPRIVHYAIPHVDSRVEVQYPSTERMHDIYVEGESLKLISETKS